MRKDPSTVGSYVHVMKRGTRGIPIVRDEDDQWRFLKLLRYLNDANTPRNWERDIGPDNIRAGFSRPEHWAKEKPYVSVLAFCLMDNHFHLLLQERVENGISMFMQRLCTSMASYFNSKYQQKGTLFQGAYKSRTVENDEYLQYLMAYISVKNPLERYPGGLSKAIEQYNEAIEHAQRYPFSSLIDLVGRRDALIIDKEALDDIFDYKTRAFLKSAKDMLLGMYGHDTEFTRITMSEFD